MISTLSKKTITKQAETIQKTSHIRHMQALDIVAEKNGFKNYQHFKETKKYKIAVFSRKGGVGKTTTSLGLYKDLDADCYYRTDFTMGRSEYKYCQIFPKVVKNSNLKPKKGLSAIYDLCRYTNLNDIDDILNDVNLFILPAKSHELQGAYKSVHTNTIKDISKYNKPIIIFSHGEYTPQKKKNLEILKNLEIELKEDYKNIYYVHINDSKIYNSNYIYDAKILKEKRHEEFYLDTYAKGFLQIYSETKKNKHTLKKFYVSYIQFLKLIEEVISKPIKEH
ncbi:MAG: hypothetical protein NTW78_11835 [Campylobacterales bacterium]|nr:hypothetical protein [Campylobacterales bacterium]